MALSEELISQFVKATKDEDQSPKEETVYGTIVEYEGSKYIRIDGSELLTPISSTANVEHNERVTALIKNHTVTVTGNLSSPSARTGDVSKLSDKIYEFENVVADTVTTEQLEAESARIDDIIAGRIVIEGALSANSAVIRDLQAEDVSIKGDLSAVSADIEQLRTETLTAEEANVKYAQIDFSNIGSAAMEYFYSVSGLIEDVTVGDQTITGKLVGVTISGDLIEGNTIVAEKLVVKGNDGLYYKLNADGMKVETEQTDYNSINGSVIKAKSITATKISVDDLVAFDATIGGFNITSDSLYSGVKESVDNSTRGIYLDKNGQMAVGDSTNYIKYYRDSDGSYKLAISADNITIKSESINAIIDEIKSEASKANATYVQFKEPTGDIKVGDIWIRSQTPTTYDALRSKTWGDLKNTEWGELFYGEEPSSYVWDGSKWVLTIDYKMVKDNQTSISRTRDELSQKAEKTVVTALSEQIVDYQSEITQRADEIELRVTEVANSTPDKVRNSTVTLDETGVSVSGGEVNIVADSVLNVESGEVNILSDSVLNVESGEVNILSDSALNVESGEVNIVANSVLNVDSGEVNIVSNSSLNVESGGTVRISAGNGEDSYINFGEAFSASKAGCSATTGAFGHLSSGGETVITGDNVISKIIVSTIEPQADGIIWLCPSLCTSVLYRAYTGGSRDKLFYNNTHSFALSCDTADSLPDSVFVYVVNFSVYLINDGDAETNVVFSVNASKASDPNAKIVFPEYTVGAIRSWEQVDISVRLETSVNLCKTADPVNISVSARNVKTNRLYLQKETYITLSVSDKNATDSVQPCTIYYKPRRS